MTPHPLKALLFFLMTLLGGLACGGGGGGSTPTPPPVTVSITPATVTMTLGTTQQFNATVANVSNPAVTWSLQEGAAGGTISPAGLYSAPATLSGASATVHVVATSQADATKSAMATVTLAPSGITVTVTPATANLQPGAQQQFTALVAGNANQGVTWSATSGSIDASGLYTAPFSSGTVTVSATSKVDTQQKGTASVTILSNISVGVAPAAPAVAPGGTLKFVAQVVGGSSSTVTWSVAEGAAGGSISATGEFTAPALTGTYHVTATSTQDSSKSATVPVQVVATLPVAVQAWPDRVVIGKGIVQKFSASVLNAANAQVIWSVQEGAAGGTVDGNGTYTAPGTKGVYHVVATSAADPSKAAVLVAHVADDPGGVWVSTTPMAKKRNYHSATLLKNGKVLVAGGWDETNSLVPLTSAEVFDPATGQFSPTGSLAVGRANHATVLLPNGTVLVLGGVPSFNSDGSQHIDLYDPATGTFTPHGNLIKPRSGHAAVLLPDGRVLVAGGGSNSCEVFDPVAKVSGLLPASFGRGSGTYTRLLPSGKVLVFGGQGGPDKYFKECELYDPATDTLAATGSATAGRFYNGITQLPDGRVLTLGGLSPPANPSYQFNFFTEIYDPATGQWSLSGRMTTSVTNSYVGAAQVLPTGRVLVPMAGGQVSQVFNPTTGTFLDGPNYPFALTFPTASVLLLDGRMLVVGGGYGTSTINGCATFQ